MEESAIQAFINGFSASKLKFLPLTLFFLSFFLKNEPLDWVEPPFA
jgi:hypothetical protein